MTKGADKRSECDRLVASPTLAHRISVGLLIASGVLSLIATIWIMSSTSEAEFLPIGSAIIDIGLAASILAGTTASLPVLKFRIIAGAVIFTVISRDLLSAGTQLTYSGALALL